jgi:CheY-like chemotaxis protein
MATDELGSRVHHPSRKGVASCVLLLRDPGSPRTLSTPFLRVHAFNSESGDRGEAANPAKKKTKIAIVEDEPELRSIYSTLLEGLGYNSIFAFASGEEFVHAVSEGDASPDLVIMDYRLPGIDGTEAARKAVKLRPGMKVIITTADDSVRGQAKTLGYLFLQKPFPLAQLRKMTEKA